MQHSLYQPSGLMDNLTGSNYNPLNSSRAANRQKKIQNIVNAQNPIGIPRQLPNAFENKSMQPKGKINKFSAKKGSAQLDTITNPIQLKNFALYQNEIK